MKQLFTLATLLILGASSAHADVLSAFAARNGSDTAKFEQHYSLDKFQIASATQVLLGLGEVEGGRVEISTVTSELRLVLDRKMSCAPDAMCPAVMPVPTVITLPIVAIESNVCGGVNYIAERDFLKVDGGLLRIELEDLNGPRCGKGSDLLASLKRISLKVTEQSTFDSAQLLSLMSGFPTRH
ncbi:MAG TPA: hypothetical protein VIH99_10590 [Bdellovibrionota bacterium]|jgi:hypothetical protein